MPAEKFENPCSGAISRFKRLNGEETSILRPISALVLSRLIMLEILGGVVASVLATGPKGCGFEPSQDDGFLRATKIRSTPSSRMGSKVGRSHFVRFYGM
jgi:hypothetical protein